MLNLPKAMITILANFALLFSRPVYKNSVALLTAHFLCTGKRTITNLLRCLGLSYEKNFSKYHYVISKAKWSSFLSSKILFLLIINHLLPKNEKIEINIDTILDRRRGPKIKGLGRHRDAMASSKNQKVLAIGHNWLVATIRVALFGSKYKWSLPFLSFLLTPEHALSNTRNQTDLQGKKRHKKITKVTCQIIMQLRRWLGPNRKIFVVADSAFACREICKTCRKYNVIFCSQLRLDASLYDFPPIPLKKGRGRHRVVGDRLPNLETLINNPRQEWVGLMIRWYSGKSKYLDVLTDICIWYHNSVGGVPIRWILTKDPNNENKVIALLVTDFNVCAKDAIELFIGRWPIETTFQELHNHLGFETIHTWSNASVNRSSPTIIASYSIACLIANESEKETGIKIMPEKTAWYEKETVTFSDVMIYIKLLILNNKLFTQGGKNRNDEKIEFEKLFRVMACA